MPRKRNKCYLAGCDKWRFHGCGKYCSREHRQQAEHSPVGTAAGVTAQAPGAGDVAARAVGSAFDPACTTFMYYSINVSKVGSDIEPNKCLLFKEWCGTCEPTCSRAMAALERGCRQDQLHIQAWT